MNLPETGEDVLLKCLNVVQTVNLSVDTLFLVMYNTYPGYMRIATTVYCCAGARFTTGLRSGHNCYCSTRRDEVLGTNAHLDCSKFSDRETAGDETALQVCVILSFFTRSYLSYCAHAFKNRQCVKFCDYWPRLLLIKTSQMSFK